MTTYQALKSLTPEQAAAFLCSGLISHTTVRNIRIFEFYEDLVKEMPRMDARTQTAEQFNISEDRISVIIRRMRKDAHVSPINNL